MGKDNKATALTQMATHSITRTRDTNSPTPPPTIQTNAEESSERGVVRLCLRSHNFLRETAPVVAHNVGRAVVGEICGRRIMNPTAAAAPQTPPLKAAIEFVQLSTLITRPLRRLTTDRPTIGPVRVESVNLCLLT